MASPNSSVLVSANLKTRLAGIPVQIRSRKKIMKIRVPSWSGFFAISRLMITSQGLRQLFWFLREFGKFAKLQIVFVIGKREIWALDYRK